MSYIWLHRDATKFGDSASLLRAFIDLVLSDEGQGLLADFGLFKLPPDLLEFSRRAKELLILDPIAVPFSFESDTALTGVGAGPRIMSKMRSSINEYELGRAKTTIEKTSMVFNGELEAIRARMKVLEAQKYPDKMARATSAAGLAFGLLAVGLGVLNMMMAYCCILAQRHLRRKRHSSDSDDEEDFSALSKGGSGAANSKLGKK